MNDFDDRARAAGGRIRRVAADLATTVDPAQRTKQPSSGGASDRPRHGRTIVAVAAAVITLGGVVGLLIATGRESTDVADVAATTDTTTTSEPTSSTLAEVQQATTTTDSTTTSPSTTIVPAGSDTLTRLTESIGGTEVFVAAYDNGNGEAEWTLPDGSTGCLRSRGLDREQLIAIVGQLDPRPADAPIPGFDYGPDGPGGLQLVAEGMNTDPRSGSFAGSQCQVPSTGLVYRVGAFSGTPIITFAGVIDRRPPVDVGVVGDSVIVIEGFADPLAPTADDVIEADEATWRELLIVPEPDFVSPQVIGGGNDVLVELVPVADLDVPGNPLTLRIDVNDGVASLVVDKRESVVADAAEYWKIEIDGRIRSRTAATPGAGIGVSGVRLGDVSTFEPGHEFTVRVSTTDGDDQTIQTTGEVRLLVST